MVVTLKRGGLTVPRQQDDRTQQPETPVIPPRVSYGQTIESDRAGRTGDGRRQWGSLSAKAIIVLLVFIVDRCRRAFRGEASVLHLGTRSGGVVLIL
jgi:hypothetical protein